MMLRAYYCRFAKTRLYARVLLFITLFAHLPFMRPFFTFDAFLFHVAIFSDTDEPFAVFYTLFFFF